MPKMHENATMLHDNVMPALVVMSGRPFVAAVPVMIIAMPVPVPVAPQQQIEGKRTCFSCDFVGWRRFCSKMLLNMC